MRELNVNEIQNVNGGSLWRFAGHLGTAIMIGEFVLGVFEGIEDVRV